MLDIIRRHSQSWVVKVVFGLIILSFVFWGASSINSDSVEVVAKVNDENIYRADLLQEFQMEMQKFQQSNPDAANLNTDEQEAVAYEVLRRMISKTLLRQEAARLGIAISDAEFSAAVTSIPLFQDATGKFSDSIYKTYIGNRQMSVSTFERMYNDDLLMDKLRNYIGSSVTVSEADARRALDFELERRVIEYIGFEHSNYLNKIKPADAEIITYYSENKEKWRVPTRVDVEYLNFSSDVLAAITPVTDDAVKSYYTANSSQFMQPAGFKTRHILISMPLTLNLSDEQVAEARAKAEKVIAELKAGKKFEALAKEYSDDPTTKNAGGELGWAYQGQFDPAFETAALALKPGEVSEPVRSYYGFHVIELLESSPESPKAFADVKDEIYAQLKGDAAIANLADAMAQVEDKIITGETLETIGDAYKVKVLDSGLMSPTSIQALLELPDTTFADVANLKPGYTFPAPFDYGQGFIVLRLKEYAPTYVPELEAVKDEVVAELKAAGAQKLAEADADAALKRILAANGKVPADLAKKVKNANVTRMTGFMLFEPNDVLTKTMYTTKVGEWLGNPYTVREGSTPPAGFGQPPVTGVEPGAAHTILVHVKESLPVEDSDWEALSKIYIQQVSNLRKENLFEILLSELHAQAKVEVITSYMLYPKQQ